LFQRKIESYREEQRKGQTLNNDQLSAIEKVEELNKTLAFAHELYEQYQGIASGTSKVAKKQMRKEAHERATHDVSKIVDILIIQVGFYLFAKSE
jgi:hypothetical protein